MYKKLIIESSIAGLLIPFFLKTMGMSIGKKGVLYYSEVHKKKFNSIIHTLFMPITVYGGLLWIPALLNMEREKAQKLQLRLYIMFMTHYITINYKIAILTSILYRIPLVLSYKYYNKESSFKKGIITMTKALLVQEWIGHYLSGDPPSRIEAIPNAILYSIYYSISHFF